MFRGSVVLIICAGCGCALYQLCGSVAAPSADRSATGSARQIGAIKTLSVAQTEHSGLIPVEADGGGYDIRGYDYVHFGPVGEHILAERSPEALALLKRTLEYTDGPRTVIVDGLLHNRRCDYALLIAEELLDHYGEPSRHYSFGPYVAYEYRDEARRRALKTLFGSDAVLPEAVEYVYLNVNAKDISEEKRRTGMPGTP